MSVLINNKNVSPLGMGTWSMGGNHEKDTTHDAENIAAIRYGAQNGITFINGAEVYGAGHTDELIGQATKDLGGLVLASKLSGETLKRPQTIPAATALIAQGLCQSSIDLLFAHWPDPDAHPDSYIPAMLEQKDEGIIGDIGVSNFSLEQLKKSVSIAERKGHRIAAIENKFGVLYRGGCVHPKVGLPQYSFDKEMQDYCRANDILMVAYTPTEKGKVAYDPTIQELAHKKGVSAVPLSLAWVMDQGIVPIVKSGKQKHMDENIGAINIELSSREKQLLNDVPPVVY